MTMITDGFNVYKILCNDNQNALWFIKDIRRNREIKYAKKLTSKCIRDVQHLREFIRERLNEWVWLNEVQRMGQENCEIKKVQLAVKEVYYKM